MTVLLRVRGQLTRRRYDQERIGRVHRNEMALVQGDMHVHGGCGGKDWEKQ
jgi:hypothetical protein